MTLPLLGHRIASRGLADVTCTPSSHTGVAAGAAVMHGVTALLGAFRCWVKESLKPSHELALCLPCRWLFHCHIFFHQFMGQAITFNVAPDQIAPPPANMVPCPAKCTYNFGAFNKTMVATTYAKSGLEVPLQ